MPPSLDTAGLFGLIGAAIGIFFSAVLAGRRGRNRPARLCLALLIFCLSVLVVYDALDSLIRTRLPHLLGTASPLIFLTGPLAFLYIRISLRPGKSSWARTLFHFAPFAAAVAVRIPYYALSAGEKAARAEALLRFPTTRITPEIALRLAYLMAYGVLSIVCLNKWSREARAFNADPGAVDLGWLRTILQAFSAILAVSLAFLLVPRVWPWMFERVYPILRFCEPLILILVGYRGLIQPEAPGRPDQGAKYGKSPLRHEAAREHADRILEIMKTEEPFLDPDLTLPALAGRAGLPAYQLSQVLNEQLGRNFYEFVNGFRIEKAKTLLGDPAAAAKLLAVAYDSGFRSKSTFNRVFKEMTGSTPSAFRKR